MDFYTSHSLSDIRRRQANESVDEDKRIQRRVLDNEFAFVSRLNKETTPSRVEDKRISFNIDKYINQISSSIQNAIDDINAQLSNPEYAAAGFITRYQIDIGRAPELWNELVSYLKSFRNLGKMSMNELNNLWVQIDSQIGEPVRTLMKTYSDLLIEKERLQGTDEEIGVTFENNNVFRQLYDRIKNKELSPVMTNEKPIIYEGNVELVPDDLPEQELVDGDDDEEDNAEEDADGDIPPPPPEEFIANPLGFGKKRGKKGGRKKMDDDEIQLDFVVKNINDFKKNEQELKHPKKSKVKPSLPYDDARDSNYKD